GTDLCVCVLFFFFQAEDGIRDRNVTGVQTCALPIFIAGSTDSAHRPGNAVAGQSTGELLRPELAAAIAMRHASSDVTAATEHGRSEERRVGKEWRAGRGGARRRQKRAVDGRAVGETV